MRQHVGARRLRTRQRKAPAAHLLDVVRVAARLPLPALRGGGVTRGPKRRCGGIFTADPDIPPEPFTGRLTCICRLIGEPDDSHHDVPPAPDEDARSLAAGDHHEETE